VEIVKWIRMMKKWRRKRNKRWQKGIRRKRKNGR